MEIFMLVLQGLFLQYRAKLPVCRVKQEPLQRQKAQLNAKPVNLVNFKVMKVP
jgi:hypothetical protein